MTTRRVHVTGASGTGTTTVARALASHWEVPHADSDDYFWEPTDPPYRVKRDEDARVRLMREVFVPRPGWVLSGSLMGWGDVLVPDFDVVVFLHLDPAVRVARLSARERARYGAAIDPGGARYEDHCAFLEWAQGYDDPAFTGRSRRRHEEWLAHLPCPVISIDADASVADLVQQVLDALRPVGKQRPTSGA